MTSSPPSAVRRPSDPTVRRRYQPSLTALVAVSDRIFTAAMAVMVVTAALSGCSGAGGERVAEAVVRDSAGVQIVENPAPAANTPPLFQLPEDPMLILGGGDEDPLFRVRGVLPLSDGSVVVANAGALQLRYYAPDGALLRAVGGKGGGPGEFQVLDWVELLPSDSVIAFDRSNRRFTVFDPSGVVARSYQPPQGTAPRPVGLGRDGVVLVRTSQVGGGGSLPSDGLLRDTSAIALMLPDGDVGGELARVPGDERIVHISESAIEVLTPPFAPRFIAAATKDGFWVQGGDGYELEYHDLGGRLLRLVRLGVPPREVTGAMQDAFVEGLVGGMADGAARQAREQMLRSLPVPGKLPPIARLLVDPTGRLWAQDFMAPGDSVALWRVFDPDGRYLGQLPVPRRFTPQRVEADRLFGVELDENDVEEVRVYPLGR